MPSNLVTPSVRGANDAERVHQFATASPTNAAASFLEPPARTATSALREVVFARTSPTDSITEATATKIDEEARAEADNAAEFAEASPYPTAADIQTDVYWEADNPSERKSQGRLFFD